MTYFNCKCDVELCSRSASIDCKRCKHNVKRNSLVDNFEPCDDKDVRALEKKNGKFVAHLVGSAEQGGIVCPACGYSNNAYIYNSETHYECEKCGLPLLWAAK